MASNKCKKCGVTVGLRVLDHDLSGGGCRNVHLCGGCAEGYEPFSLLARQQAERAARRLHEARTEAMNADT